MSEIGLIERKKTAFLLIDMQEKFLPVISGMDKVIKNTNILVRAAQILGVHLIVTEQYPAGLGKTIEKIEIPQKTPVMEKTEFSCLRNSEFLNKLKNLKVDTLVIFGIETHVCVLQTALDAIANGYKVHIVADAVSSRTEENRTIALDRMRQAGAFIDSTEILLFQLLEKAGTTEFREISMLIK